LLVFIVLLFSVFQLCQGTLILGSGQATHNMRSMGTSSASWVKEVQVIWFRKQAISYFLFPLF
jgi:hypothetical protein